MAPHRLRVVIVEDEALLRDLLCSVCAREFQHEVIAALSDGHAAVDAIVRGAPDMVLLDLRLPQLDGLDVVAEVRARGLAPRVLVLSAVCDAYTVRKVERAEISGFLHKTATMLPNLRQAMNVVAAGGSFFCPSFRQIKARNASDSDFFEKILSPREQTVLAMLSDGMTDREIGSALGLSPRTVESHRMNMLRKLGLGSKLGLERYAKSCGFTQNWQVRTSAAPE